jgi:outer membrane protein assembly factor BamB
MLVARTPFIEIVVGLAAVLLFGTGSQCALGQLLPAEFELSDTVHLDEADSATRAHLERVQAYLNDSQWDEAVETLRQVMETHGRKVISAAPGRYVSIADYCHLLIAALPAPALKLYRDRVDPLAGKWYEEATRSRQAESLQRIVDQFFCSSWGDKALWLLGELALERGHFGAARGYWESLIRQPPTSIDADSFRRATEHGGLSPADFERITQWYLRDPSVEPVLYRLKQNPPPSDAEAGELIRIWASQHLPQTRLAYPGTSIPLPEIRARLILVSILEGNLARARAEIDAYQATYPDAAGTLAGRHTNFARGLASLYAAAQKWPPIGSDDNWPTFAGNFARNGVVPAIGRIAPPARASVIDLGEPVIADQANNRTFSYRRVAEDASALLSYHPVVAGELLLWANHRYIHAINLNTGKPAWKGDPTKPPGVIYDDETLDSPPVRSHRGLGVPRYTLTVHNNKVYARMGSQVTSKPVEAFDYSPGHLVCLDLAAEGRILWKVAPEAERWSFEGPPVVDGPNVYVAMRRSDVRPQAHIACLDAETGKQKWQTFICSAETPGGGQQDEITHNLLTLNEGVLYLNTNLGAVASVAAHDGHIHWIRLYNRARKASSGGLDKKADHFYRDLNPCIYHQGLVYAAPSDCEWILAIDATTGQIAWDSRLAEDAIHLLGVSQGMLMASGNKLWWIDATGGKVRAVWPGSSPLGFGRGLIAGNTVLWTTRDALHTFALSIPAGQAIPQMLKPSLPLAEIHGATGGNLIVGDHRLLLTTADKIFPFKIETDKASE